MLPTLPGLETGIYHYESREHALEQRCSLVPQGIDRLGRSLPPNSFLMGLSSSSLAQSWKYGVRAYRYVQHDLGHAIAAVRYAAAALGWSALLLDHLGDDDVAAWLGLDRETDFPVHPLDREHPGPLMLIGPGPLAPIRLDGGALDSAVWAGQANSFSREHVHWQAIDEAARAAYKGRTEATAPVAFDLPPLLAGSAIPAATLIRQRRSCLALDGQLTTDSAMLYGILDHLLPRTGVPPWDVLPWPPQIDLALFVHRVRGWSRGCTSSSASPASTERRRRSRCASLAACRGCWPHLPLYRLMTGDLRALAQRVSCHQDIAAAGAFSLGMLARHAEGIRQRGAWWYRRLFWEAGVLGQVLYLEAEAAGLRGTGIGCFFDDAVHQALGLTDERWQSLYHFTIGGPIEDHRLRTLAPYAHLTGR